MPTQRFATAQLSTGPRLHYCQQGAPDGEPLLFLHGWPDSWFTFSRVLSLLPADIRVFAIDQRGFGDSERPSDGYDIRSFADDAAAFLDAVSIDRAAVVGHSFGSFVARQMAITHPGRVSRLVLIGTGATADNAVTRDVQAAMGALPDPVPAEFAREFQASTAYAPLPAPFFERVVAESLKLPARLWREIFDRLLAHRDVERLGQISAPALLVWGVHDALFPRTDQEQVAAAIPGAVLKVYEETGHCPNWERPERLAADLQAFCAGPTAGQPA